MINKVILDSIDKSCQIENEKEGRRTHLGASVIGDECERKTWYSFRWAKGEEFSGRMLRLFSRGHFEEPRFVEYLRAIGFEVFDTDAAGKQWRIKDVSGHFGGSCDGKALAPTWLAKWIQAEHPEFDLAKDGVLTEFKTISYKYFGRLQSNGVKIAQPKHWFQMCTYGLKMGLRYALYMSVNKNTDELHIEFLKLDWADGEKMIERAHRIITAPEAPPRAYEAYGGKVNYKCEYCNYKLICHFNAPMEKNCRSCVNAQAVENAEWHCALHNSTIPPEFIEKGCDYWEQLPNV